MLPEYSALVICTYNLTNKCDIQPTGVVTMAMEVLHNTCNMCIHDLNPLGLWAYISGKSLMPMLQLLHAKP